jgi:hypothetical protein
MTNFPANAAQCAGTDAQIDRISLPQGGNSF